MLNLILQSWEFDFKVTHDQTIIYIIGSNYKRNILQSSINISDTFTFTNFVYYKIFFKYYWFS